MAVAAVEKELRVIPPESVAFGGESVRCGGKVYRALKCLMARTRGADMESFCQAVWGKDAASVPNETTRSVVFRVNQLLKGLGCPKRMMVSADRILFE